MFCTNCGKNINEGAKFCQYCGMKTVISEKGSMTEETVPNYPGEEYTVVYSPNGQGENRVEKFSDGRGYQPDGKSAGGQSFDAFDLSQTQPAHGNSTGGFAQETVGMGGNGANAFGQAGAGFPGSAPGGAGSRPEDLRWGTSSSFGSGETPYPSEDGFTESTGPITESAKAYTSKVFNSPILGVAGIRDGDSGRATSETEEDDSKGNGVLIAIIVILILLILLVGFGAFAYIQGLIDF